VPAKVFRKNKSSDEDSTDAVSAYPRITRFCAYQERSHYEVREKLQSLGLSEEDSDAVISKLITDGFVNEERFAKSFAGGKFRMKKWGRIRIEHALQSHQISTRCIAIGLREIDEEDYRLVLERLIMSKAASVSREDEYQKWDAVSKFVIGKGYEPELVWNVIKEIRK
jgi:regulatory protein